MSETRMNAEGKMKIAAAAPEDMAWIAEQEAGRFAGMDVIPEDLLGEWHARNPTGFSLIKTGDGRRVGYVNILPVRPETLELFLAGTIIERQLRAVALYSAAERDAIRYLYVESIVVDLPGRAKAAALQTLLEGFRSIVERVCDADKLERVYAIAASTPGTLLMKRLGFALIQKATSRLDGHNLYSVEGKALMDTMTALRDEMPAKVDQWNKGKEK